MGIFDFANTTGQISLFVLLLVILCIVVAILISRRKRRCAEQSLIKYEANNKLQVYKNAIEKFKNLSIDYPERIKNLKLLFSNIEIISEGDHQDHIENQISLNVYYGKKTRIRKVAYDYALDCLSYFSEKYKCYRAIELESFKNIYIDVIDYNDHSYFVKKFETLEALMINFSDIAKSICQKMTEVNLKQSVRDKCRNKVKKETFLLEEAMFNMKNDSRNMTLEKYTMLLQLFEHKMIGIIELFDYIENNA